MANKNITQLRRLVFRKWTGEAWETFTMEADDLGQDTVMTVNVAPRKMSRASSRGTQETPIQGTYDALAATVTFLADDWTLIGKALQRWNPASYSQHTEADGNIIFGGDDKNLCKGGEFFSVIAQGLCDDGSTTDIEIARCVPSIDDDIEIGTSETPTITLNLNPVIYNAARHSTDGYGDYDIRFGDNNLETKQRLDATDGTYKPAEA